MIGRFAVGLALIVSAPANAQSDIDPARLAAAQQVVEQVFPTSQRDAMVETIVRPINDNMQKAMGQSAEIKELFAANPEAAPAFERFVKGELERTIALTKESLPALVEAMARAYARRFSVEQLADIHGFFNTPSGRAYVAQSMTMMSDPDIQSAQRAMMAKSFDGMQARIATFVADLMRTRGGKQ
jgi:hypothetical protein